MTFSVTFWVRSFILLGAMISISVGEGGRMRSDPKESATWEMRLMALWRIRSESDEEFTVLGFKSADKNNPHSLLHLNKSTIN